MLKFCYLCLLILVTSCVEKNTKEINKVGSEDVVSIKPTGVKADKKTILFFGNSLTAGMGLDPDEAFPALIQKKIDSLNFNYTVINSGLSGETTASGKNRLEWVLKQKVDIFILELGANDGLRGIPLDETRKNLQIIIDSVELNNKSIRIILAGMMIPPNMGIEYAKEFQNIFPTLAKKNDIELIPFILDKVAGNPDLNQKDGIHPTAEGHKIIAENVWVVLEDLIEL